nr:hypothetical protein [Tanacetum cinerariifolium]
MVIKRSDDKEYEFSYADLTKLSLNDVKDMYLIQIQDKLYHIPLEFVKDFYNALLLFIQRVVIQNKVEDIQLGVESYQQTLNLNKPMMFFEGIEPKIPFIISGAHKGVVYLNQHNSKSFMNLSEVKKFCNGTLNKIRENLIDMSSNEEILRYWFDILHVVPIKEDRAYLCMNFARNQEELKSNTPYPEGSCMEGSLDSVDSLIRLLVDLRISEVKDIKEKDNIIAKTRQTQEQTESVEKSKKSKEDLFTYCIENGIFQDFQDTSKPSNDNTNVANALQEPFVVKQNLDKNSSQSTLQINHHCCYECGDSLEDIFCHQCTCELCGKGAHYVYNYPLKVSIISNPEPCNNQTIDELPQTVLIFDPTCYYGDGNSFTYDSKSNLVDDSPNVFNPPPQTSTYSYEFCGNDDYYGHDCPLQFPVIHQPIREKTCAELLAEEHEANIITQPFRYSVVPQPPQEKISVEFLQEKRNQIDSVKTFLRKFNRISFYEMPKVLSLEWETILEIELAFKDKHCQPEDILELFRRLHNDVQNIHEELAVYINTPSWDHPTICYNDDDDEDCTIAITPKEPNNSLSMRDEHLNTISATESDEFIKSSVENLVPNPSESEGEHDDDQSFSNEYILKKIYSNPLFDEEIISMNIDPHHFNAESDLIKSLLNYDSSIISSSKIDSLLDEFADELILLKSIPPGINETNCDPEEETRLIKKLLYDNSSPHPPKEFILENSDAAIESFSPFPIPVEDSDSYMAETDLSFTPDDPMPPDIEEDDYDSERDILILEELLSNDFLSFLENESFHFDIPSSSRPPAKSSNGNSGILNVKVMGDIFEHKVPMPRLMLTQPTLVPNQEKSPNLLSHQGHEASQPST